ncbi:hypothetical protein AVEN_269195-1 [Araneus ventricosus]|uniref:DUF7041 domain-containing protein n=1 Tax=Araneus ventricosus TaxID=182803 RepID=A0A4Y2I1W5_ARAVE|nr:hypothetical protein AVEN_269195-1 [Araneus ventricosus]
MTRSFGSFSSNHNSCAGISNDSTKFHSVLAALNSNVLSCVRDIVKSPPLLNAYSALKDGVLQQFAQSNSARLNLLLKDLQLGDKHRSHLLSEVLLQKKCRMIFCRHCGYSVYLLTCNRFCQSVKLHWMSLHSLRIKYTRCQDVT